MSWIEKIQTDLSITTGDGATYTPNWLNASKQYDFNLSQFVFKELEGELVDRRLRRGRTYNIEIYFQGEDHLDTADAFDASSADPNPWTISHPFYGDIVVQPSSLLFDNTVLNTTKIVGIVIETIAKAQVKPKVSAPEKIAQDKLISDQTVTTSFSSNIPEKKISVLQQLQGSVDSIYNNVKSKISATTDASAFFNKYNEVNALINATIYDAEQLMGQIQGLINMPAQFAQTVKDRLAMFQLQYNALKAGETTLTTASSKIVYQSLVSTVVTANIVSAVTNIGTAYINRKDVVTMINTVYALYNDLSASLDGLQTDNGGDPESFIPDPAVLVSVAALTDYAIGALLDIANDSRQERAIYLEEDSNIVLLADRFYGYREDDSHITELMESNQIGLNEILGVKKGRRLVYYI